MSLSDEELMPLVLRGSHGYSLFTLNPEGVIDSWYEGARAVFGWSESEALGQDFVMMFVPEDAAREAHLKELAAAARDGVAPDVRWHLRKDGTRVFIHGSTRAIFRDGSVTGFLKIGQDVTALRHAEAALGQMEQRYRAVFETMDDGFVFGSVEPMSGDLVDFRFHAVNPAFERLCGRSSSDLIGNTAREVLPELEEVWYAIFRRVSLNRRPVHHNLRSDALGRWLSASFSPMAESQSDHAWVALAVRDITKERMLTRERNRQERRSALLAERNRMAQELHDTLAQGFTGIKLQYDLAENALNASPANVQGALEHVQKGKSFTQACQADARRAIRALRMPILEKQSLAEALETLSEVSTPQTNVSFALNGAPVPLSPEVENDLYRVAQEALTNSLRYSCAGQVQLSLTYFEDEVHLAVVDDGNGFDLEQATVGLGILGMRERAERIGAHLTIDASPGVGSTVSLELRLS